MPKVSIAIPTYNRKNYLIEAVRSILRQTFRDFEVIIFDNNSDYDIAAVLESFNDERIKLVVNSVNIGNQANFQKVFSWSYDSKYLLVFHDDDVMHPELLRLSVAALDSDDSIVISGTNLNFVGNPSDMWKFKKIDINARPIICDGQGLIRLIMKDFDLCFDSILYRTSKLEDIRRYQERFSKWADRPFIVDIARKGKAAIFKEKLVNYRLHQGQDSTSANGAELEKLLNLNIFYQDKLDYSGNHGDKKLFRRWSTNNLILSASTFSKGIRDYFSLLKRFQEENLLFIRYLNLRGVLYFFKSIARLYLK